jgi:hypothetical protein
MGTSEDSNEGNKSEKESETIEIQKDLLWGLYQDAHPRSAQ